MYGAANFHQGGSRRIGFRGAQATISHWRPLAICSVPAYVLSKQIRFCDRTVDFVTRAAILPQIKTSDRITPGGSSYQRVQVPAEKSARGLGRASVTQPLTMWISGSVDQQITNRRDGLARDLKIRWDDQKFENSERSTRESTRVPPIIQHE
jgi:hypothetical protein